MLTDWNENAIGVGRAWEDLFSSEILTPVLKFEASLPTFVDCIASWQGQASCTPLMTNERATPCDKHSAQYFCQVKLVLGFALVIVLTVLIALTGWTGITSLSERSERISDIGKLSSLTRDVRIARLAYSVNYDAERASNWLKAFESLENHVKYAQKVFDSPLNVPLVNTAADALKDYRIHYDNLMQATAAREATRSVFGQYADAGADDLQKLNAIARSDDGTPAQRDAIVQAMTLFQKMRFDLRGYTYSLKPENRAPAETSMNTVIESFKICKVSMASRRSSSILWTR